MRTITIIEDEKLLGSELKRRFEREGWSVTLSPTLADARRLMLELDFSPSVVLSDMNLPDGNGLDFLEEVRAHGGRSEWIFLSGYGSRQDIARAAKLGALDFLAKPLDYHKLDLTIATATRGARARQRMTDTARSGAQKYSPDSFIGQSPAATQVRTMLGQLATVPVTSILLGGETGTGKGLVAKILHYSGQRAEGPFVDLNCAAIPRDMLESELFGHEPGAFTGAKGRHRGLMEQADGGTLFLDEIGEMDIGLQSKLLKAIEEQSFRRVGGEETISVDIQLIAASNRDLRAASDQGDFRRDLYHRISVFELRLPSLRERTGDIAAIVTTLFGEFNARSGKQVSILPPAILETLQSYSWPGNVRELRNVIERSVMLATGPKLPREWLGITPDNVATSPSTPAPQHQQSNAAPPQAMPNDPAGLTLPLDGSMTLDDMEECIIRTVLERHDFNVMAAVRALGTTRETLRYRIRKYGLEALVNA
ncbi:sigma-54-dependent transcriptional regulator [Thalassospira mesophila]|uniref:Fis family transcriptional regulator n=1 Tax=Thalassospira mesophila TaxID=1293891 RepID=A0A1Y2L335_9PROT|nr:sigma-54 dependent transcriptional regulator [Thalassospira mesophila]OSQ39587.1 Fis family transcriptional regulator [Thalassospira mesophila]